jgi:hypothetical protein
LRTDHLHALRTGTEIPHHWIQPATEAGFEARQRVDLPDETAFGCSDLAEKPPFTAFYRFCGGGGCLRTAKVRARAECAGIKIVLGFEF